MKNYAKITGFGFIAALVLISAPAQAMYRFFQGSRKAAADVGLKQAAEHMLTKKPTFKPSGSILKQPAQVPSGIKKPINISTTPKTPAFLQKPPSGLGQWFTKSQMPIKQTSKPKGFLQQWAQEQLRADVSDSILQTSKQAAKEKLLKKAGQQFAEDLATEGAQRAAKKTVEGITQRANPRPAVPTNTPLGFSKLNQPMISDMRSTLPKKATEGPSTADMIARTNQLLAQPVKVKPQALEQGIVRLTETKEVVFDVQNFANKLARTRKQEISAHKVLTDWLGLTLNPTQVRAAKSVMLDKELFKQAGMELMQQGEMKLLTQAGQQVKQPVITLETIIQAMGKEGVAKVVTPQQVVGRAAQKAIQSGQAIGQQATKQAAEVIKKEAEIISEVVETTPKELPKVAVLPKAEPSPVRPAEAPKMPQPAEVPKVETVKSGFTQKAQNLVKSVQDKAQNLVDVTKNKIGDMGKPIVRQVNPIAEKPAGFIERAKQTAEPLVTKVKETVGPLVQGAKEKVTQGVQTATQTVKQMGKPTIESATQRLKSGVQRVGKEAQKGYNRVRNGIRKTVDPRVMRQLRRVPPRTFLAPHVTGQQPSQPQQQSKPQSPQSQLPKNKPFQPIVPPVQQQQQQPPQAPQVPSQPQVSQSTPGAQAQSFEPLVPPMVRPKEPQEAPKRVISSEPAKESSADTPPKKKKLFSGTKQSRPFMDRMRDGVNQFVDWVYRTMGWQVVPEQQAPSGVTLAVQPLEQKDLSKSEIIQD